MLVTCNLILYKTMKAEQKFYQWFKKQLPLTADCCRVETSTMGGMPDTTICWKGIEVWVELKVYTKGRCLIRPEQNAWMHRRAAAGGRVFLLADHETGYHIWSPPFTSIPYGEYLQVTSNPFYWNGGDQVVTHIFSKFT